MVEKRDQAELRNTGNPPGELYPLVTEMENLIQVQALRINAMSQASGFSEEDRRREEARQRGQIDGLKLILKYVNAAGS